jgi:transposase
MGKYTLRKKLVAVRSYCSGKLGQKAVAKQYNVDVSSLRQWIAAYRAHGMEGLKEKKREFYSAEFKLEVLRRVEEERLSYRQAAALFDIRKFDIIGHWKRQYEEGGVELLSRGPGRRNRPMTTQSNYKPKLQAHDDDKRTREELLEEVNQLRMENAYLKKSEALAQENKQTMLRKERKSCLS